MSAVDASRVALALAYTLPAMQFALYVGAMRALWGVR